MESPLKRDLIVKDKGASRLVGGFAALIAIAVGILGHVDAIAILERAAIAYVAGSIGCQVLHVMFTWHTVKASVQSPPQE